MRHAQWEANMKMFKSVARAAAGLAVAGLLAIGGSSAASALTFQWTITNNFGSAITVDTSSCSPSGSISAPFSIASHSTMTFTGTSTDSSGLCNVRYQSGIYGCQFQVEASSFGGFASTNAYKGTGNPQSPICTEQNEGAIPGGYQGTFEMH
jgi:hypothetical protein